MTLAELAYTKDRVPELGSNQNLFDFTENTNVAYAHYLAAVALTKCQKNPDPDHQQQQQAPKDDNRVDGKAFFYHKWQTSLFLGFHTVGLEICWGYDTIITRPWAYCLKPTSNVLLRLRHGPQEPITQPSPTQPIVGYGLAWVTQWVSNSANIRETRDCIFLCSISLYFGVFPLH